MADLFNQQISATYSGLLKTSSSGVLSASLSQISDGRGNTSPLYLSTDSIQFYGAYSFPSSDGSANQVLKTDGAGVLTWEDDANSGTVTSVALSVPTGLTVTGSPITTSGTITIDGTLGVANGGTGATTLTGILVGNGTNAISVVSDGTVGQVLSTNANGTYSFIDAAGGDVTKTGAITANQIAVWNDSTDELRSDETVTIGTDHSITLYQPNTNSNTTNYIIGGGSSMTTGELNTGFGSSVLTLNTTGVGNIAIGSDSLTTNVSGYNNVAVGVNTLKRTTASNNVAIGNSVLQFDTTGYENTAIGGLSQYNITTAYGNTSLGYNSLIFNSTGIQNTAIGWNSLKGVSTYSASNNTAIGYNSGSAITTGSYNVIIGSNTGSTIATSSSNIIISDGIGNIRQSFDFTGTATFSGNVDIYKTTDSQLQIKSLNEDATLIINSGADGVGGANREEGFIKFYQANADFFTLGKRNNGQFVLTDHTGGQDVITFQDGGGILLEPVNGSVGIGGSPSTDAKLELRTTGATAKPPSLRISNNDNVTYFWDIWRDNTNGYLNFGSATGSTVVPRLTISSGGDATFSGAVNVVDAYANDPLIKLATNTSGNAEVQIRTATTSYNAGIGVVTSGYDFNIFTENTPRLTISSGGSVNVGAPVVGHLGVRGLTNDSTAYAFEAANSSGNSLLLIRNDGAATFSSGVTVSGNLSFKGSATRNINFYDSSNSNINSQIQYDQITSNTGQLFFKTADSGTLATRLTISSSGYIRMQSTVGTNSTNLAIENASFYTALFRGTDNNSWAGANTSIYVGQIGSTNRSINCAGTVNTSGNDYAEYMKKSVTDNIIKGDIVGIDSQGLLTNIFSDAISFSIKSTKPSFVGGDSWFNDENEPKKGENQSQEEFDLLLLDFQQRLEAERIKYDRIAFSGQVPCNVIGASVGDYIIPIASSDGKIIGEAISNPTFDQYKLSVGKVWKIMEDGRSWVAVKIG